MVNQVKDREEEGERRLYWGLARGGIPNNQTLKELSSGPQDMED